MGESTCLMHAFSYASGTPNEAKEGNPIHALGESISFGRFMSESLSWEKWSSFSHNKYVEEAEKFSKPGSVAQKKAFFEAHYKRIAAQKAAAAALQEQANAAGNHNPEPESEVRVQSIATHNSKKTTNSGSREKEDEQQGSKSLNKNAGLDVKGNVHNLSTANDGMKVRKVERDDHLQKAELSSKSGDVDNNNGDGELELSRKPESGNRELELSENSEMEKPLLKEDLELTSKKKPALSSTKSSVHSRAPKVPRSPAKPKATTVNHLRKENNATQKSRNSAIDSLDKKISISKPIHMPMNSTPAREPKNLILPSMRNIISSKVAASSSPACWDCLTPLRTPTMESVPEHSSATPQSDNRRTRRPLDPSAYGSKTNGPKWRFLTMDFPKSLSACRNKSYSPFTSSPFSLRTEERAARRKQKLEEKFDEKESQKVQLQTKLKDKAESELRKLRQSLCFKARPLPDFYRDRKTPKNQTEKPSVTMSQLKQSQSPKPGKRPNSSREQITTSLPPRRPATKKSSSKHVQPNKNDQSKIRPHTSLAEMIMHENTSPNIQLL